MQLTTMIIRQLVNEKLRTAHDEIVLPYTEAVHVVPAVVVVPVKDIATAVQVLEHEPVIIKPFVNDHE